MLKEQRDWIEEKRNTWYTIDEALQFFKDEGTEMSKTTFEREVKKVDENKEIGFVGYPKTTIEKNGKKGRPLKKYNYATIEALRTFAISDTFKKVEEAPLITNLDNEWKNKLIKKMNGFFEPRLDKPIHKKDIDYLVDEATQIVSNSIVPQYQSVVAQNKLLVSRNRALERAKEYYIAEHKGIEERANELNRLSNFVMSDIRESSKKLARKEALYFEQNIRLEQKVDEILKELDSLSGIKNRGNKGEE